MRHFLQIAAGIDVLPLLTDLYRNPELWNQHTAAPPASSGAFATILA